MINSAKRQELFKTQKIRRQTCKSVNRLAKFVKKKKKD